jgi:hypothetical protein
MVTDEELLKISYEIDDFLLNQIVKNNIEPINLSGIMLARLIRMCENSQSVDHFYELIASVANKKHLEPETRTLQ